MVNTRRSSWLWHLTSAVVLSTLSSGLGAAAVEPPLSFTDHFLNLDPSRRASLLGVDSAGDGYEVSSIADSSGRERIHITKTNPQGVLVASYDFGGTGQDTPAAIAIGIGGSVIVVGSTTSSDFPVTTPVVSGLKRSAAFVVAVDGDLTRILSSTVLGGSTYASSYQGLGTLGSAVAVDASGNIYVGGSTAALDFPVTPGAVQTTPPGYDGFGSASYAFLAELSPSLKIIASTYYGSDSVACTGSSCIGAFASSGITALAMAPDASVVAGGFTNHGTISAITTAAVVLKFAAGASKVVWVSMQQPDPGGLESITSLAADGAGSIVLTGSARNGGTQPSTALQTSCAQGGFVTKLDSSGQSKLFSTYFGCSNPSLPSASVNSVVIDSSGTVWIVGSGAATFPVSTNAANPGTSFVAGLAPDGSAVRALYTFAQGVAGQAIGLASDSVLEALGSEGWLLLGSSGTGPSLLEVANAAGSGPSGLVASAELVSLYGQNLGPSSPLGAQISSGIIASSANGYELLFDNTPAPLLYVASNQINAIVPGEVFGKDSIVVDLVTPQGRTTIGHLFVRPSEPEVFHDVSSGYASAINQDGHLNSAANPARAGTIVSMWATGAGAPFGGVFPMDGTIVTAGALSYPASPASVLMSNGSELDSLEVLYAGDAPNQPFGVIQTNFLIPSSLASGTSSVTIRLQVGSAISAPVSVYVTP